jgi:agmatine/peptidylarginine deiminase
VLVFNSDGIETKKYDHPQKKRLIYTLKMTVSNFDLDIIIKERPKLNLLCLDNKLIFPSMNPDLQKQAADILSKHGYEIAFLDSETTSSGSGFGGGIHCVTLQAPIQDAPTHRARP